MEEREVRVANVSKYPDLICQRSQAVLRPPVPSNFYGDGRAHECACHDNAEATGAEDAMGLQHQILRVNDPMLPAPESCDPLQVVFGVARRHCLKGHGGTRAERCLIQGSNVESTALHPRAKAASFRLQAIALKFCLKALHFLQDELPAVHLDLRVEQVFGHLNPALGDNEREDNAGKRNVQKCRIELAGVECKVVPLHGQCEGDEDYKVEDPNHSGFLCVKHKQDGMATQDTQEQPALQRAFRHNAKRFLFVLDIAPYLDDLPPRTIGAIPKSGVQWLKRGLPHVILHFGITKRNP
mmetsp:Transcript_32940/g.87065  ORF Transcript_32940/g.87065 Transcript_32940/m.87065 type:complete len:297 (-) Transcript_32940:399-1289(-)